MTTWKFSNQEQSLLQDLDGDYKALMSLLDQLGEETLDSYSLGQNLVKLRSLQVKLLTLQGKLIDLFSGSTTKSKEAKSAFDVTKQPSVVRLKNYLEMCKEIDPYS